MENKKVNIDLLLERTAARQLKYIDWDRLNSAISSRLDIVSSSKTSRVKYQRMLRIAAGFVAAAVVFIVMMFGIDRTANIQPLIGRNAIVKFIDNRGTASVEIKSISSKSQVMIDIGGNKGEVAKCKVEVIDLNGEFMKNGDKSAWIIITMPQPALADNGLNSYVRDLICLF